MPEGRMIKRVISESKKLGKNKARIPHYLRVAVAIRDEFTCQNCGEVGDFCLEAGRVLGKEKEAVNWDCTLYRRIPMEIDHIIPKSKGGKAKLDNLQLLCRKCNRKKKDKLNA
jgi:5-methylcytosine-specific restriction endonuclease McrA